VRGRRRARGRRKEEDETAHLHRQYSRSSVAICPPKWPVALDFERLIDTLNCIAWRPTFLSSQTAARHLRGRTGKRHAVSAAFSFMSSMRAASVIVTGLISSLLFGSLAAAEPVDWLADHAAAVAKSRKQGKLLLVVHLSGDFAKNSPDAPEAKLYRQLILADARVAAALADRYVVTYRHVGEGKALPRLASTEEKDRKDNRIEAVKSPLKPPEMAIAYICLPDERVLHFVPGFVSPLELLAELEWVEATYSRLVKAGEAEMPATLRAAHREVVDQQDLDGFASLFPTRWTEDSPAPEYTTVDLPEELAAARSVWDWSQRQRLGVRGPLELKDRSIRLARVVVRSDRLAALAAHGRLGSDFAHLVLSEFPLAYLSDLAGPAFEACAGQRFWQASSRREELAQWWVDCSKNGRRTLLIAADDSSAAAENSPPESHSAWPADDAARLAELWRVATQVVTIDELAALLSDANLPPLAYDPARGPPRFILHDARGFRYAEVGAKDATAEKLADILRTAVGPGAREKTVQPAGVQGSNVKE